MRIQNFQEVTTANESSHNVAAFSFGLFTGDLNDAIINQSIFELQSNSSSGQVTFAVPRSGINQTNRTTEGVVTYRFTVSAARLGVGPLVLTLMANVHCLNYYYNYCNRNYRIWCTCEEWQHEVESETLQIGARRGTYNI